MSDDTGPVRFSTDPKDAGGFVNETDSGVRGRLSMERLSIREYTAIHMMQGLVVEGSPVSEGTMAQRAVELADALLEELAK